LRANELQTICKQDNYLKKILTEKASIKNKIVIIEGKEGVLLSDNPPKSSKFVQKQTCRYYFTVSKKTVL
jgi:hypothetical protein